MSKVFAAVMLMLTAVLAMPGVRMDGFRVLGAQAAALASYRCVVNFRQVGLQLRDLAKGYRRAKEACAQGNHGILYNAQYWRNVSITNPGWRIFLMINPLYDLGEAKRFYPSMACQDSMVPGCSYCGHAISWRNRIGNQSVAYVAGDGLGVAGVDFRRGAYLVQLQISPGYSSKLPDLQTLASYIDWRNQHYGCVRFYKSHAFACH